MKIVTHDPSYTAWGICIIDEDRKKISLNELSCQINKHQPSSIMLATIQLPEDVYHYVDHILISKLDVRVGLELATTYGQQFQAELYAIDAAIYRLMSRYTSDISLYSTTYINWLKGKGYKPTIGKKEDTIFLVEKALQIFTSHGYSLIVEKFEDTICDINKVKNKYPRIKTITSGEADATMLALRIYVRNNDDEITKELLELIPRLSELKELE